MDTITDDGNGVLLTIDELTREIARLKGEITRIRIEADEAIVAKYVYMVISFTAEGQPGGLAGIFEHKNDAVSAVLKSDPHEVWEWAFSIICIEKYRLNSLGHPARPCPGDGESALWFLWHCDEPFEKTQTGRYLPMEPPEWSKQTVGWV